MSEKNISTRTLFTLIINPAFAWAVAATLGIVNMIPSVFIMNPDGISYLNLASLYQHGDWASAINGYWSPLYPILIAGTLRLFPPSAYYESTVVHVLTFALFMGTFAAFRFFLSELRESQDQGECSASVETFAMSFRSPAEVACAYSLFFWAATSMIGLALVTPDMMVALIVFVAAGLTLRLRRIDSVRGYAGLGAVIGLGYLAKSVMFPLGIVFCVFCGFPSSIGSAARRSMLAFAGFLVIASPQLIAMSSLAGHFSYGQTGAVAYANQVNHIPQMWVGAPAGSGTPVHPVHQVSRNPAAYEFSLVNTTFSYPISDELAYWMQGVRPRFSIAAQLSVTRQIVRWYLSVFALLVFSILVLFLLGKNVRARYLALIMPALATFAIYALVYVESRYLAAWLVVLFLSAAASIQYAGHSRRGVMAVVGALAVFYGLATFHLMLDAAADAIDIGRKQFPHAQFETASELKKLGLARGSRVGAIGYSFNAYWARLSGVQIATQVPEDSSFWTSPDSSKANILRAFREAGAVAVVSISKPKGQLIAQWKAVGPAGFWVLMLSR